VYGDVCVFELLLCGELGVVDLCEVGWCDLYFVGDVV